MQQARKQANGGMLLLNNKSVFIVNYKKTALLLFISLITVSGIFSQAINISKPAAAVNLIKSEMISVQQLDAQVKTLNNIRVMAGQAPADVSRKDKLQVLDMMISDLLIMQGAERDGIKAEPSEVSSAVQNQKSQYEQQLKRGFTDAEFRNIVSSETGYSWSQYTEQITKQIVQQKYILAKKQAEIQKSVKMPDNTDIEKFYRENKTKFTNPDMVRYSQIFISTLNLDYSQKQEAEKKADEAYRKYQNGSATFEKLVNDYTEDQNAKYRNGDSGFIAYNDPNANAYLGKNFIESLFSLKEGEVSGVVKSNIGYHILKVTDYREAKLLSLDDNILPTVNQTVREYIAQQLISQAQNVAVSDALKDIVAELRDDADIKIFEDNID